MKPALIATDLDGTFLGAHAAAHPDNMAAAREIVASGIELVIATGRSRRGLQQIEELRDINPMVITINGASAGRLCAEEPEITQPIEPSSIQLFAKALPAELDPMFAVDYVHEWGCENPYPQDPSLGPSLHVEELPRLLRRGPILKVSAQTRHVDTDQWVPIVLEAAKDTLSCTFSWPDRWGRAEISAPGVSKGSALAEILERWGIDPVDCAAFGDMPNDLEMLQLVGDPFVMAGAHPSLLKQGFTRIGHHHDGAVGAQWLLYLEK